MERVCEGQILDVLRNLLPQRVAVPRAVLIDRADSESPKIDGVLLDRTNFPLLYSSPEVAMVESAVACIEVKSRLTKAEFSDILAKGSRLRTLQPAAGQDLPLSAVFAYKCPNANLAFFDFSSAAVNTTEGVPDLVCILNEAVFCFSDPANGTVLPRRSPGSIPSLLRSSSDALLVFFNLLCEGCLANDEFGPIYRAYSEDVFTSQELVHFEADFLAAVSASPSVNEGARRAFLRRPNADVIDLCRAARERIGLPREWADQS